MCSGRGRSTLEASLDLKRSCDLAALWDLDRGSRRTRRYTEHRIRPGDPRWNIHMCRGKSCRKARALGRSHCERCILISEDLFDISLRLANPPIRFLIPSSLSIILDHRFSRRHLSFYRNRFPLKYSSRSYLIFANAIRHESRLLQGSG